MMMGMVARKTGGILDMEGAEVVAEEATLRAEVATKGEVEAHRQAIIMTETMAAGETKEVREEEDMAAVVARVDGAIDATTTGIGTMRMTTWEEDPVGVRVAMMDSIVEGAGTEPHLVETHTQTMEAQTLDHELRDHQEVMHR